MYILDTDHLSILQRQRGLPYEHLLARLRWQQEPSDVATTIASFQEQVQGWMASLSRAGKASEIVHAYAQLQTVRESFCKMIVLPFDLAAQARFDELRRQKVRIGTMDLRIACIALTRGATLLTRNLRDFKLVPGLSVEDWTV